MEHMIQPVVGPGPLQGQDVLRLLDDADLAPVALAAAADGARVGVGNINTYRAQYSLLL